MCLVTWGSLGFRVSPAHARLPGLSVAILCTAVVWGKTRGSPRLTAGATAFLQMTLFTVVGVALSYALAARAAPLWDHAFAAADAWLGFDWPAVFRAADVSPVSLWIGGIVYHGLAVQMIVAIVVLSATGRTDDLRVMVAAAIVSGWATIAISGFMPAMGNLFDPKDYRHLWPSVAWLEGDLIAGLRDGSQRVVDLTHLWGIVSFPSYHATLAIVLAWGLRNVAGWRRVAPLWAGLTIVATPLFGGHYAVDILAGVALAFGAVRIAPVLVRRWAPRMNNVLETGQVIGLTVAIRQAAPRRGLRPGVHVTSGARDGAC